MKAVKITEGIYWVGGIDWTLRNFHGYTTHRGATYNAYLIIDEKITLIDTVKGYLADEMISRISSIIDPSKIDYIISNHVEMDHSGAIPQLLKHCPNATVYASTPFGQKGLTAHYGDKGFKAVPNGSSLSLGKRSLTFVNTPMVHWPDNMVTFCPEEGILFSNDAFGQHYASTERFDDEAPMSVVLEEAKKYFANIVMPYWKQVSGVIPVAKGLNPKIIAPSHGIIWRSHIDEIFAAYEKWCTAPTSGALVVYDSMWHSTEIIAHTIAEALGEKGVSVKYYDLKTTHISDIIPFVLDSELIAVGSPTLNNNMLPTVAGFLCYLKGLSPKGRRAFSFGSYGWSGQSPKLVEDELKACGFDICMDPVKLQYIPTEEQLEKLTEDVKALIK